MFWAKLNESTRTLLYCVTVTVSLVTGLIYVAQMNTTEASPQVTSVVQTSQAVAVPTATFAANAGTLGAIPDGPGGTACGDYSGSALNVTFTVTGITAPLSDVRVSFTGTHTWLADLDISLRAPSNAAIATIFKQTGATTPTSCGSGSDISGTYNFFDTAPTAPTWWGAAASSPVAVGNYRVSTPGGAAGGGTNALLTPAFAGLTTAQVNGTWTLRVQDGGLDDTGSITAATLTLTGGSAVPVDANADFNGDGRTDYTVARAGTNFAPETSNLLPGRPNYAKLEERPARVRQDVSEVAPQAPVISWWIQLNNSATVQVFQHGDAATDFITPEDFDGDTKDDLAVWTPGAPTVANFKVLQSSNNTVAVYAFGQVGDDPAVVGDYDGDNKADPAVFRCPLDPAPAGQCYFFYRGSLNNPSGNITYVPFGFGLDGDFFPYVGDFDGDNKNDFCLQRSNPVAPSQGQFVLLKSAGGVEYIDWGLSSDFLIPGDYDGDGKTDICVRRTVSGVRQHWILFRNGTYTFANWGVTGDSSAPGDYDGDGKTDLAIWRGSATPGQSLFWINNSSNGTLTTRQWGQCPTVNTCDFAVAGWAVH